MVERNSKGVPIITATPLLLPGAAAMLHVLSWIRSLACLRRANSNKHANLVVRGGGGSGGSLALNLERFPAQRQIQQQTRTISTAE